MKQLFQRPALLAFAVAALSAAFLFAWSVDLQAVDFGQLAQITMAGMLAAPAAAGVDQLEETLTEIGQSVEEFKTRQADELKEMRANMQRLETRLSRPGLQTGHAGAEGVDVNGGLQVTVDGKPVRVLCKAGDFRAHFERRADGGPDLKVSDFLRAVANLGASPEARAVLSVGTDADGGHLVPSRLMGGVLEAMVPESALLNAGAGVLPVGAAGFGAKGFTMAAVDTVPQAAWRLENGAVAESSPGFRAVLMTPRSLSFYFRVSREWLADAIGVDGVLMTVIAQAFAKELDRAGLLGTGTAPEPRGLLNTANVIAVGNGVNGASLATLKFANFLTAVQQLLEANASMPTASIMSPRSRIVLAGLADSTGQPLQRPELLDQVRMLTTSQLPNNLTVGTSTDCSQMFLGDFAKMVFAMRERMSIQMLNEQFAVNGQVGFLAHVRADVAVLYPKAFAVVTGIRP